MEGKCNSPEAERSVPVQFLRGNRAFKQFKNPPQPHMCIQDTIKNTSEKLFINVLGWQKIANTQQNTDPIPLYGGMQISRCRPKSTESPSIVFAVMVNPEILKLNGKNAENPSERDALVNLLCDFVEAKNPGLELSHNPVILKDRDLAGELKDVWFAVTERREREKYSAQEITHKIYQIDMPPEQLSADNSTFDTRSRSNNDKDSDKIDSSLNNGVSTTSPAQLWNSDCQRGNFNADRFYHPSEPRAGNPSARGDCDINPNFTLGPATNVTSTQSYNQTSNGQTSTVYTPMYGQIMSTRECHLQTDDNHMNYVETTVVNSAHSWESNSCQNRNNSKINKANARTWYDSDEPENERQDFNTGKRSDHYDFFPIFDSNPNGITKTSYSSEVTNGSKTETSSIMKNGDAKEFNSEIKDKSVVILETLQKLALDPTINSAAESSKSTAQ